MPECLQPSRGPDFKAVALSECPRGRCGPLRITRIVWYFLSVFGFRKEPLVGEGSRGRGITTGQRAQAAPFPLKGTEGVS